MSGPANPPPASPPPPAVPSPPPQHERIAYNFAVLRVVPHVHTGAFVNVGVALHARTAEFLGARVITDAAVLRRLAPDVDIELLARYLESYRQIAAGDEAAGPVALLPPSERFHWMTSPRSDVLQSSPVHAGLSERPEETLDELFCSFVTG
ncbi:MAG TPA: DUF3037 domain-containing protein [Thermoanaerobaculia bacterium]|jgi:hypothetical protein|nr:DUF3037 domain-containing protein [Thermoanaerobaculia bacterium]